MNDLHQILIRIYQINCPEKLSNIPTILVEYKAREVELLTKLADKYNLLMEDYLKVNMFQLVEGILKKNDPIFVNSIGSIMSNNSGKERELLAELRRKYGTNFNEIIISLFVTNSGTYDSVRQNNETISRIKKKRIPKYMIISLIALFILVLGFVIFQHYKDKADNNKLNNNLSQYSKDEHLTVPFDSVDRKCILNLDATAGTFYISGATDDLVDIVKSGDFGNYSLTSVSGSNLKVFNLTLENARAHDTIKKNKVNIKLNPTPCWSLKLNVGAADLDIDLMNYKIDTASINAGASTIKIRVGDRSERTNLIFDAGASSIEVEIPEKAGCRITSDSFLVSKNFKDFDEKENHTYETSNFNNAITKIYITAKITVSSFHVNRY